MTDRFEHVKGLFKGITWMQVGAGALAAATSLFLSSSIGIAGSIIGAAVGSVVTTLSSAVYKGFFTASDKAIKKRIGIEGEEGSDGEPPLGAHAAQAAPSEDAGGKTVDATVPSYPTEAFTAAVREADVEAENEKTLAKDAAPTDENRARPQTEAVEPLDAQAEGSPYGPITPPTTPSSPPLQDDGTSPYAQALAAERACNPYAAATTIPSPACFPDEVARVKALAARRKARRRERVVAVGSLATGLAAVALCAAVILGATDGGGIGHRPGASVDQGTAATSEPPLASEATETGDATNGAAQEGPSDPQAAAPGGDAPVEPSPSDATTAAPVTGTETEGVGTASDGSEGTGSDAPEPPEASEAEEPGSTDAPETGGSTVGADESGDDAQSSTGTEAGEPAEAPTPAADDGTSGAEGAA